MGLFKFKGEAPKNDKMKSKSGLEEFKPYYMVNGILTKENHPFCLLWKNFIPFFNGLEDGIDKNTFKQIIKKEHLNSIPDGDGYGYRKIVFSEREMVGRAWTMAIFPCRIIVDNNPQTFFVVTGTGERGVEGSRCYFKEKDKALSYFCAWLRSMKNKYK